MKISVSVVAALVFFGASSSVVTAQDWDGFYVGGYAGYQDLNVEEYGDIIGAGGIVIESAGQFSFEGSGAAFGVFGGQNFQHDRNVFGWEMSLGTGTSATLINPRTITNNTYDFSSKFEFSLSGRYGYLVTDRDLLFVSGGLAYLRGEHDWVLGTTPDTFSVDTYGYTLGVGWEREIGKGRLRLSASMTQYEEIDAYTSDLFPNIIYYDTPKSVDLRIGYSIPLR